MFISGSRVQCVATASSNSVYQGLERESPIVMVSQTEGVCKPQRLGFSGGEPYLSKIKYLGTYTKPTAIIQYVHSIYCNTSPLTLDLLQYFGTYMRYTETPQYSMIWLMPNLCSTGPNHRKFPNHIKLSIFVPHRDGMLPAISTEKLSNFDYMLSPSASRVGLHRYCTSSPNSPHSIFKVMLLSYYLTHVYAFLSHFLPIQKFLCYHEVLSVSGEPF